MFEDSGPGIQGARNAGALAVLVPEHDPFPQDWREDAHEILSDLHFAPALLQEYGLGGDG